MENKTTIGSGNSKITWKLYVAWAIRIVISSLFLISAFAKIYPDPSMLFSISKFEFTQLYPMGFGREFSAFLSRFLIGIEFALGFLIVLPFNLKKVVIPSTILMLAFFCVHLTIEILTGGNKGNCGCFGSLLPMTPLQALIKNLVSIGLLVLLYLKFKDVLKSRNSLASVGSFSIACIATLFLMIPMKSQSIKQKNIPVIEEPVDNNQVVSDTVNKQETQVKVVEKDTSKVAVAKDLGPKKKKSGFVKLFPKIDDGKKVLCFFAPTCDHCMATAKELTELKRANPNFPDIYVIFMDEGPEEIPAFFKFAGAEYPYYVMDIIEFWQTIGNGRDTPGVAYLWNGNVQKFYSGIDKDKFNKEEFKKIVQ
jgi:thiol-disulfide isomerase/thioredoxin